MDRLEVHRYIHAQLAIEASSTKLNPVVLEVRAYVTHQIFCEFGKRVANKVRNDSKHDRNSDFTCLKVGPVIRSSIRVHTYCSFNVFVDSIHDLKGHVQWADTNKYPHLNSRK